ncbi:cytochrome P450, partial [Guyanagaster necrorhizus]
PILYKVTKLYGAWICWKGYQHLDWKDLHDEYGPIVRTGPNEVSIIDAQSIITVFGTRGLPKGIYYTCRHVSPPGSTSLILLTGASHTSRRRIWSRGLNAQAIKNYEVHISERATQLAEKLQDLSTKSLDLVSWLSYFAVDFMGDMAFGGGTELIANDGQGDGIFAMMDIYWRVISAVCHVPWAYQAVASIVPLFSKRFGGMRPYTAQRATNRIQSGSKTKDLWYHLMDKEGFEKSKPPVNDVIADSLLAVVAGSDTTASAMSCMLWCLLSDRDCFKRLQHEIDTVFPDGADALDVSRHSELPYLRACM